MEKNYPWIPWREPWHFVKRGTDEEIFMCRFCAALYGVEVNDNSKFYHTREEWEAHLATFHPREEDKRAHNR